MKEKILIDLLKINEEHPVIIVCIETKCMIEGFIFFMIFLVSIIFFIKENIFNEPLSQSI